MKQVNSHIIDSRAVLLLQYCSSIQFTGDEPCLKINTKVYASMKEITYATLACFSDKHLIYCECKCESEYVDEKKVTCAHVHHLLLYKLVKHVLTELIVR